jgi:ElaB/YqjD/DUF883 family membrane-anchored ribosome-binding protein
MSEQAKEESKKGFFKGAVSVATQVAQTGIKVEKSKEKTSQIVEDGVEGAKRLIKKGRYAAEDLVEETAHRIKKDPFRSVGVAFGVGLGLGAILGGLFVHTGKKTA